MNAVLFLAARAIHVLAAAIWIGSTVFVSLLLVPVVDASGPSGGQVMMGITRRGISTYMSILGALTAATGVYLLWRFTGGFDPAVSTTHAGLAFCVGGTAGILAGIVGGAVVGRSSGAMATLAQRASAATDEAGRAAASAQIAALRRRMKAGSRAVIALQTVAAVLMAIGHYV